MRRILASIASISLLGFASAAYADSITYSVAATTGNTYSVSGTFTLDSSTGQFSSVDITENQDIVYDSIASQGTNGSDTYAVIDGNSSPEFVLYLSISGTPALDNSTVLFAPYYAGLTFLSPSFVVPDTISGTITPVVTPSSVTPSATPEPSSLMLLGSGILGVAGVARRRFLKS